MCRKVITFTYGKCGCKKRMPSHRLWILKCDSSKCVAAVAAGQKKPEPVEVRKKKYVCRRHQRKWGVECPSPYPWRREREAKKLNSDASDEPWPTSRDYTREEVPNFSFPRAEPQTPRTPRTPRPEETPAFSFPRGGAAPSTAPSTAYTRGTGRYDDEAYSAYTSWTSDEMSESEDEEDWEERPAGRQRAFTGPVAESDFDEFEDEEGQDEPKTKEKKKKRGFRRFLDVFDFLDSDSSDDESRRRKK